MKEHWKSWKHLDVTSHCLNEEVSPGERKGESGDGGRRTNAHMNIIHTLTATHT